MQKIKLTREEAEKLAKYIQEKKQVKLEHEQGELETYLVKLESLLNKFDFNKEIEEIEASVIEFEAFETYKRGL